MGASAVRAPINSGHPNGWACAAECTLSRSKTPPSTFQRELFLSIRQRGPWRRLRPHSISDLTRLRLLLTSVPSLCRPVKGQTTKAVWKTELCGKWGRGLCLHGERCMFAHGAHELQQRSQPRLYKTQLCKKFVESGGHCPYRRSAATSASMPSGRCPRRRQQLSVPRH